MSGHSKWAQIKRQKGAADIKRGQAFTKIANAITIAVKEGGGSGDPNQNFKLRLTIEKAREVNMPKENVERAIERGLGKGEKGEGLSEVLYEGFGPGGVAIMIDAVTDNKQRTTPVIKSMLEKNGGTMGSPGAVSYQFQTKGVLSIKKGQKSFNEIFMELADKGVEDIEEVGDEALIYTKPEELSMIKEDLSKNFLIMNAELIRVPTVTIPIEDVHSASKILSLIEKLEQLDDVQKVYANFDIPEQMMQSNVA